MITFAFFFSMPVSTSLAEPIYHDRTYTCRVNFNTHRWHLHTRNIIIYHDNYHVYITTCIGSRNATSTIAQPVRLMYRSVSDVVSDPGPSPSPRSSLTHVRRYIGSRNATSSMAQPARFMYLSVFYICFNFAKHLQRKMAELESLNPASDNRAELHEEHGEV